MKRILCLGNRLLPLDAVGPAVYDRLCHRELPADVELIDGGLAGLDLLRFVEGAERVVFVDALSGYGQPGEVLVLEAKDVIEDAIGAVAIAPSYDHGSALVYLLSLLPRLCAATSPEMFVVGIETPAPERALLAAAEISLRVARGEYPISTVEERSISARGLP